jgi:hypothetical protein
MKILVMASIILIFFLGIATAQDVVCPDNTRLKVQWFYEGGGDWFPGPYTYCCNSYSIKYRKTFGERNILYCMAYQDDGIGMVLLRPPYTIIPFQETE